MVKLNDEVNGASKLFPTDLPTTCLHAEQGSYQADFGTT